MRSDKKGISAIVATVLIILITVAAVTIIWAAIIPMIQDTLPDEEAFETRSSVITSGGYTAYDSSTGALFVQVEQFGNISRLDIIVSNKGTSYTWSYTDVPANNQMKTYEINLTDGFAISNLADTVYVRVIPYVPSSSGPDKQGTASGEIEVKSEIVSVPVVACEIATVDVDCIEPTTDCDVISCVANECQYDTPSETPDDSGDEDCDGYASLTVCGSLNAATYPYRLENDISGVMGVCFNLAGNDIILDGNGKEITYSGSGVHSGITASNVDNLIVRNFANIRGWYKGIEFSYVDNYVIEGNTLNASSGRTGISVENGGSSNRIENNNINYYGVAEIVGINMGDSINNTIKGNNVLVNCSSCLGQVGGIAVGTGSGGFFNNNTIEGNNVIVESSNNNGNGIYVGNIAEANFNQIISNTIQKSPVGIYLYNSGSGAASSNTIDSNNACGATTGFTCNGDMSFTGSGNEGTNDVTLPCSGFTIDPSCP
jgi:parallel beta-helix repeat protein